MPQFITWNSPADDKVGWGMGGGRGAPSASWLVLIITMASQQRCRGPQQDPSPMSLLNPQGVSRQPAG